MRDELITYEQKGIFPATNYILTTRWILRPSPQHCLHSIIISWNANSSSIVIRRWDVKTASTAVRNVLLTWDCFKTTSYWQKLNTIRFPLALFKQNIWMKPTFADAHVAAREEKIEITAAKWWSLSRQDRMLKIVFISLKVNKNFIFCLAIWKESVDMWNVMNSGVTWLLWKMSSRDSVYNETKLQCT